MSLLDHIGPNIVISGCDPLTPDDIAEIVVFSATRPENVVLAESLVYPNHQASSLSALLLLLFYVSWLLTSLKASALIMHRRPA